MKEFIIEILLELLTIALGGIALFLAWNEVVPELFHYKDITFVQSLWIACAVRVLTFK